MEYIYNSAAVQVVLDSGADEILIPQGVYPISDTLKIGADTKIIADKTAKIVLTTKDFTADERAKCYFADERKICTIGVDVTLMGGNFDMY